LRGEGLANGKRPVEFTAIPYYAWQNRGIYAMTAWPVEDARRLADRGTNGPTRRANPAK
jgi:hypothetical protein